MKYETAEYELPVEGVAWTRGAGHPAAVYLLAGRCHFVAGGSPAEEVLVVRGALHMANVRFDQEQLERGHRQREVRLVPPEEGAELFQQRWSVPLTNSQRRMDL
ncbi:hypothetical protein BH23GEM6_BH23GEM6_01700 [soil metagenome]